MRTPPRHVRQFSSIADWAAAVSVYLSSAARGQSGDVNPTPILLARRGEADIDAKATEDGLLLYNALTGTPEYSKNGEWLPVTYSPTSKTYGGSAAVPVSGTVNVAFPEPFPSAPAVTVTALSQLDDEAIIAELVSVSATGFSAKLKKVASTFDGAVTLTSGTINWVAFGAT